MGSELRGSAVIRAEQLYQQALSTPQDARPAIDRFLVEAEETGDREAQVIALRAAGFAARELYDHNAARTHLDAAVRVARSAALPARLCEVLITRSATNLEMGDAAAARRDLVTAQRVAGPSPHRELQFAVALLEDTVGNLDATVAAYRRVLDAGDEVPPDVRFKALNNLALTLLRLGRYDEAEDLLGRALRLARTFSPMYVGYAAESMATSSVHRGHPVEAMQRYEHAEQVLAATGVQLVDLYIGKADALLRLQLLDEAADAARRAVELVDGVLGGSLMLAEAKLVEARTALAQGRLAAAAAAAGDAEELFRRQHRWGWRVRAALLGIEVEWHSGVATAAMASRLAGIERRLRASGNVVRAAQAALLLGDVAAALRRPRQAIAAFDRASEGMRAPALLRLQGRLAQARKAELLGDRRRLSQVCRAGLEELATYRSAFASAELRVRAAAHGASLAQLGLRGALRSGRPEAIWTWMERARAVVAVREGSAGAAHRIEPLLARLRGLETDLHGTAPEDLGTQTALFGRIAAVERQIRQRLWGVHAEDTRPMMPSVASLRALRSDLQHCALLQYTVLDGQVIGVAVTAGRIQHAQLGPARDVQAAGQQLAFALRRLGRPTSRRTAGAARASADHELDWLTRTLTEPFGPTISAADEVVVVPPADLVGIPWGALRSLTGCAVRVVPTATLWDLTRNRHPRSDHVVLVAGPDLAAAEDEVQAIAECYDDVVVLTGDEATADRLLDAAPAARAVHFACHGRLRRDTAAFSSLRLADGPLTVHDLERLAPSAHHWILAACDLGSPGELVGHELDGVLAALLLGGAGGVVAAVVAVPDLETSELMTRLHGALASGAPLAHAVQAARTSIDTTEPTGFVASVAFSCYGGG